MAFVGAFLTLDGYAAYSGSGVPQDKIALLSGLSLAIWSLVLVFFIMGVGSSFLQLARRARNAAGSGRADRLAMLGEPFLTTRGRRLFVTVFAAYLLVFSWASTILVIRPGQDFTATYGVPVPSTELEVCCGPVGTVPSYTVFVAQGLGLLLIPANVLLALIVSLLAALSTSVSVAALSTWRATSRGAGSAGLAGVLGFVASCPSCAGQVLLGAILGPGSTAVALALAPWQLYLGLASVGILFVTLWAQTRWIERSRQACRVAPALRDVPRPE